MNLVIFDIDGTLTDTNPVDERCFRLSVRDVLGLADVSSDWSAYRESTDSGIFRELFARAKESEPSKEDMKHYQDVFRRHLEDAHRESDAHFRAMPGVIALFEWLRAHSQDWAFSIATGAFRVSAEFKLQAAQLWSHVRVAAFSDDADQRAAIIKASWNRAIETFGQTFDRVLYVGDGQWDLKAARELGIPYVGLNRGERAESLAEKGASHVLPHYEHLELVIDALRSARVPS